MCEKDVTGKLIGSSGGGKCEIEDNPEFTLKWRWGSEPGALPGESLSEWWRGTVTYCGGQWDFLVYCLDGQQGCESLYAFAETVPGCVASMTRGGTNTTRLSASGSGCNCDPLVVNLGAFAGVSKGDSACCCEDCTDDLPSNINACNFEFSLQITE
jgi:hypothetical protein